MKLLVDILQGLGVSQAAGIRPFLPALVTAAAGKADVLVDFGGSAFAFLEATWWILLLAALAVTALILRNEIERRPPLVAALQGLGMGIGGLLFAGILDGDGYAWWPGIPAGIAGAWLAGTATRDLFSRAAVRLDDEARAHLPVYAEGIAIVLAALAIVAPPVSLVAAGFFVWLLVGGRRRTGERYAGLRILR